MEFITLPSRGSTGKCDIYSSNISTVSFNCLEFYTFQMKKNRKYIVMHIWYTKYLKIVKYTLDRKVFARFCCLFVWGFFRFFCYRCLSCEMKACWFIPYLSKLKISICFKTYLGYLETWQIVYKNEGGNPSAEKKSAFSIINS